MTSDRKKPGLAFWATVVVVCLPLLYVLSFGPASLIIGAEDMRSSVFLRVYGPLVRLYSECPQPIQKPIRRYVELWLPDRVSFTPVGDWFFYFDER